jgi:hypothetical protein
MAHPAVAAWLEGDVPEESDPDATDELVDAAALLELSYEQARDRFGVTLVDWVKARKVVIEAHKLALQSQQMEGKLIEREFMEKLVFSYLDALNRRLLSDVALTASQRLRGLFASGASIEEGTALIRDLVSASLKSTVHQVKRSMLAATPNQDNQA